VLLAIQKLGRGLREYPSKIDVKMFNYIEHFPKWTEDRKLIREKISDRFNAVIVSSMLDDMFYPILMPTLPGEMKESPYKDFPSKATGITLEDLYGSKRNDIIEELLESIAAIPEEQITLEYIDEVIDEIIERFAEHAILEVDPKDIKERLRKEILRRHNPENENLRMDGIIVDFVREKGWDKVIQDFVAPNSPFVGRANTDDLKQLQKFLVDEWHELFERLKVLDRESAEQLDKNDRLYRFYQTIRQERRKIADKDKQQLLTMARNGEPKPNKEDQLGVSLANYTDRENECYDPIFDKEIRELAPNWFKNAK
jgi:hypothetical protein